MADVYKGSDHQTSSVFGEGVGVLQNPEGLQTSPEIIRFFEK